MGWVVAMGTVEWGERAPAAPCQPAALGARLTRRVWQQLVARDVLQHPGPNFFFFFYSFGIGSVPWLASG